MKNWNQLRVAYQVGIHGTVSEAASILGVHRSTVIRQLDSLEQDLGQKLFLRHPKGYTLTDTGKEFMQIVRDANEQIGKGIGMIKSKSSMLSGELVVTALERAFSVIAEPLKSFLVEHPNIRLKYEASARKYRLEYGEAHLAIRTGSKPTELDYIVQPFFKVRMALYASKCYCARFGIPKHEREFENHRFALSDLAVTTAFDRWHNAIPESCVALFCHEPSVVEDAIRAGIGIGWVREFEAKHDPELIEVMPNRDDWTIPLWLVTHVDQHKSPKLQACLKYLKEWARENFP